MKGKGSGSGWRNESRRHSLARKGVKTARGKGKVCDVANPMNTRSNKELLYGHSLTHTKNYQKSVGVENARCEHDRLVAKMKERGMEHKSPFKSKLKASGVSSDVARVKKALINKAKNKRLTENFGQNEVRRLRDKYSNYQYGTEEQRKQWREIESLDDWAMDYTG